MRCRSIQSHGTPSAKPFIIGISLALVLAPMLASAEAQIDVVFTNPECPSRPYEGFIAPVDVTSLASGGGIQFDPPNVVSSTTVPLRDGQGSRSHTRKGTYCFWQDAEATDARPNSVFQKLKAAIESMEHDDQILISTFSFSNRPIASLLCEALGRGASVELVTGSASALAADLASGECRGGVATWRDGSSVSSGRLQHAKFMLLTDSSAGETTVTFQSANLSSGVNLHHENWTFIKAQSDAPFVQRHLCQFAALRDAHFNDPQSSIDAFRSAYAGCHGAQPSEPNLAIEPFFVPATTNGKSDGQRAMEALIHEIEHSEQVDVISHHLTNKKLVGALIAALGRGNRVRLIMDDELFWVGNSAIPRSPTGEALFTTSRGYPIVRDPSGLTIFDHYSTVSLKVRARRFIFSTRI
jgi:hypothetical protein